MDRILIRFNTKFEEDPQKRTWRVLVNGQERLAEKILVRAMGETIQEAVNGVHKYHVMFYGTVTWNGDIATISNNPENNKYQLDARDQFTQSLLDEINREWENAGY